MTPIRSGREVPWLQRLGPAVVIPAVILALAACGPNTGSSPEPSASTGASAEPSAGSSLPTEPVTLRVAYYNAGGQTEIDYRQAQAEAFMAEHENVTVKMEPVSDWGPVVTPQLAAGTAADVLWADTDTGYGEMVGLGAYQPLTPFIEAESYDLSPWPETIIKHFSDQNGDLLLLPNSNLSFNFVYYNKAIFDAAGEPYPTDAWTVDDLMATARRLSVKDEQWGLSLAWSDLYLTWMRMYGCEFADDTTYPTQYTYNGPGCAEALEDLDQLSREGVLNWEFGTQFGTLGPSDAVGEQNFSAGNVAMLLSGTWEAGSIAANSGGAFEFDAAAAPLKAGGTIQGAASGYGVYAKAQNPEWAWEYVKYLSGPEGQVADAKQGLGQSPIAAVLDEVYCTADAPPANRCAIAKAAADTTVWEPVTDKWGPGFWDIIGPAVQEGFNADEAPDWQALLDAAVADSQEAEPLP